MRIAHVTWAMDMGGKQTLLTGIANEQVKMGHEVGLFILDNRIDETIMNKLAQQINVFCFGRAKGTRSVMPFVKLNWQLWRFRPDIIHSHAGKLSKAIFGSVPIVSGHVYNFHKYSSAGGGKYLKLRETSSPSCLTTDGGRTSSLWRQAFASSR